MGTGRRKETKYQEYNITRFFLSCGLTHSGPKRQNSGEELCQCVCQIMGLFRRESFQDCRFFSPENELKMISERTAEGKALLEVTQQPE